MSDKRQWLSIKDLAALLERPEPTVRGWRARGRGPRAYVIEGRVRYRRGDVDSWLEAQADREPAA